MFGGRNLTQFGATKQVCHNALQKLQHTMIHIGDAIEPLVGIDTTDHGCLQKPNKSHKLHNK